jgi:hypothetical protein
MLKLLNDQGEEKSIASVDFYDPDKAFQLRMGDESFSIDYLPELHKDYAPSDYELVLLYNDFLNAENDIFQVKVDGLRIGWIASIQALQSAEHKCSNNPHFLKYSYVGYQKLLLPENDEQQIIPKTSEVHELTNFYYDSTIVLILCNANTVKVQDFTIDSFLPSLAKYGYYAAVGPPHPVRSVYQEIQEYYLDFRGNKVLSLFQISRKNQGEDFISELYGKLLYKNTHHLVKFHLLYQVVELLIDRIFASSFDSNIELFQNGDMSRFDLKDKISSILSEKERIDTLINNCGVDAVVIEDLHNECNNLLRKIESEKNSLSKSLYRVRNNIVHSYRTFSNKDEYIKHIQMINFRFELFVSRVLEK